MGKVLPDTEQGVINFAQVHAATWLANASSIGISDARAQAVEAAYNSAVDARSVLFDARQAVLSASIKKRAAMRALREELGATVKLIKADADAQPTPSQRTAVYSAARLDIPRKPGRLGPPPSPSHGKAVLNNNGDVTLSWKGETYGGTYFVIERRAFGLDRRFGPWSTLGTTSAKTYVDTSTPSGVRELWYRIRARRHDKNSSDYATATATFGSYLSDGKQLSLYAA